MCGILPRKGSCRVLITGPQERLDRKRVLLRLYACSLLSRITMSKICSLSAEKEAGLCFRWEYSSASDIEVKAEFIIPDSSGHCKKGRIEFTQWLNQDIAIITASIFGVPRKRRPLDLFPVCGHSRIRLRVCRLDAGCAIKPENFKKQGQTPVTENNEGYTTDALGVHWSPKCKGNGIIHPAL